MFVCWTLTFFCLLPLSLISPGWSWVCWVFICLWSVSILHLPGVVLLILGWPSHVFSSRWLCVQSLSLLFCSFCLFGCPDPCLTMAPCTHSPLSSYYNSTVDPLGRKIYFCKYQHLHLLGAVCLIVQLGYSHNYYTLWVINKIMAVCLLMTC